MANIVWNYSPFIAPTTRSAKPTAKLRRALGAVAHDMLEEFLRKWRRVRGDSGAQAVRAVRGPPLPLWVRRLFFWLTHLQIVDTVLAKLFAQGEKTTDLFALLDESDVVVFPEVESVFRATGQYGALCKVYSKRGDDAALLETWSKYVSCLCICNFWQYRTNDFFLFADLSRENGQIPRLPIRCQTCLRCSQHGVTVR